MIIGQDTTSYGKDLSEPTSIHQILRKLADIDGVRWIRGDVCNASELYDCVQEVRPEVRTIVQEIYDQSDPHKLPKGNNAVKLSKPGYTVDLRFTANPFHGQGVLAHAVIKFRGEAVRALPPIPVFRSTLTPPKKKN